MKMSLQPFFQHVCRSLVGIALGSALVSVAGCAFSSVAHAEDGEVNSQAVDRAVDHFLDAELGSGDMNQEQICDEVGSLVLRRCLKDRAIYAELDEHYLVIFENDLATCTFSVLIEKRTLNVEPIHSSRVWLCIGPSPTY